MIAFNSRNTFWAVKSFWISSGTIFSSGNQVGHGERVQLHQPAAEKPGQRRQPVNDDERRAGERGFHGGRAAGDHGGAGMHERGAGVVGEGDLTGDGPVALKLLRSQSLFQRGCHGQDKFKVIALFFCRSSAA